MKLKLDGQAVSLILAIPLKMSTFTCSYVGTDLAGLVLVRPLTSYFQGKSKISFSKKQVAS